MVISGESEHIEARLAGREACEAFDYRGKNIRLSLSVRLIDSPGHRLAISR